MPVASRFPKGFLSLIGANNFGENPRDVAYNVQPTVDLREQYLIESTEALFGVNAAGATGFNAFAAADLVVPAGEVWRLLAFAVTVVSAVGQTGRVGPSVRTAGPGSGPRFPLGNPINYIASETNWVYMDAHPFWLSAGYQLGFEMAQVAGGSPTVVSGGIVFQRLRA